MSGRQMVSSPKKKAPVVRRTKKPAIQVPSAPERPWLLNTDEVAIIKNSVAKGASDQELQFCLTVARRYRLDPFKQQIWFVRRWSKDADNGHGGKGGHIWTPQVGINGLLFAAARDHKASFGSVSLPEYGQIVKTGSTMAPEWAKVSVWKKGEPEPTVAQAWWSEYAPSDLADAPFWRKMPRRMIAKCATALAIRQAYPDLGGLYIPEECERMNEEVSPNGRRLIEQASVSPPAPTDAEMEEYNNKLSKVSGIPWKEGRLALAGPGLQIFKANVSPEIIAELDIKYNGQERVVHMPEAKWFDFADRAKGCGVEATLQEAAQ